MDRRGRTWRALAGDPAEPPPETASTNEAVEVLEGISFDYDREARCKVCTAEAGGLPNGEAVQQRVDEMLVRAATYASALEAIEPLVQSWPAARRPGYASIRRHALKHLGADQAAIREILERRAAMADVRIVVGRGRVVTRAGLLELIRDRGFEALVAGELVPSVRDAVEAAAALADIDNDQSAIQVGEVLEQLRVFATAVRRAVGEEQWEQIVGDVERQASSSVAVLSPAPQPPVPPSLEAAPRKGSKPISSRTSTKKGKGGSDGS